MSIRFHIEFEGKNKITLDIEDTPDSPRAFEQVILTIEGLVVEFRDL